MIREANINDSSRIAEIHTFAWRCAYKHFLPLDYLMNVLSVKKREATMLSRFTENTATDKYYVYEEDTIIKAFMTAGPCRDEDKDDNVFEIEGIYVDPIFQRQHIGSELVKYCIEEAKSKDMTEITLWVFEKNAESIKFYEKMGFQKDGKEKTLLNENIERMCMKLK